MSQNSDTKRPAENQVTTEEVNRVLEVGRLLFSVLTEDEKAKLVRILTVDQTKPN